MCPKSGFGILFWIPHSATDSIGNLYCLLSPLKLKWMTVQNPDLYRFWPSTIWGFFLLIWLCKIPFRVLNLPLIGTEQRVETEERGPTCSLQVSFFLTHGILPPWARPSHTSPGHQPLRMPSLACELLQTHPLPAAQAFLSSDSSWCWFQMYPPIRIPTHMTVFPLLRQHLILVCLESSLGAGMSETVSSPWLPQD